MTTVKNIVRRITLFYLLTVVLSISIAGKIVYLQFFTDLKKIAAKNELTTDTIRASRGNIFSNDMRLLAVSIPEYRIYIDFHAFNSNFIGNTDAKLNYYYKQAGIKSADRKNRSAEQREIDIKQANNLKDKEVKKLAEFFSKVFRNENKDAVYYEKLIHANCANSADKKYFLMGKRLISYAELLQLKEFPVFKYSKGLSGLIPEEKPSRNYTYNSFAAATIGNVNSKGLAYMGIEAAFNEHLQGKDGARLMMPASTGGRIPVSSENNVLPEAGCDIVTTLDVDIQTVAETALLRQIYKGNDDGIPIEGGTVIVMETKSGEIRAIVNLKRNAKGGYDESYNYALSETSPPGSTFKLATLVALLDDGHVDLDTTTVKSEAVWEYRYKNKGKVLHTFREAGGHSYGNISAKLAFAKSSNVGFAKLAVRYYEKNPQKYFDKLFSMGIMDSLKLQISGENGQKKTLPGNEYWQPQLLPLSAIGYQIEVAPIHTLTFYNAIANNGKMMKPKFVKEIRQHGQIIKTIKDEVIKDKICSKETALKAQEAMQGVVDLGTAKRIRDTRFELAGKTGTAQRVIRELDTITGKLKSRGFTVNNQHTYQATFAGYIPANNPKYTIVVVLYSPLMSGDFYGGTFAAPVFKEVAEKLYTTDVNWNTPVTRNNDTLLLPAAKHAETQQIKAIATKLSLPFESNTKTNEWVAVAKKDSKLTTEKINIEENKVPLVINMGLRNATCLLESAGLKVKFSGRGKVKTQSINAGAAINKGETIFLELGM